MSKRTPATMAVRKIHRKGRKGTKGRKTSKWFVPVLRGRGDSKAKGKPVSLTEEVNDPYNDSVSHFQYSIL